MTILRPVELEKLCPLLGFASHHRSVGTCGYTIVRHDHDSGEDANDDYDYEEFDDGEAETREGF